MALIESLISPSSEAFEANRAGMLALVERIRGVEARTRAASASQRERFHKRGQLLPRERVALLLDPGAPFLELSTLAGYRMDNSDAGKSVPGGGLIAGIGYVRGVRCMIAASDSAIDAGALQPMGLDKVLRVQEMALENKLPYVQLVESAGANLLRYRVEDFVRGGNLFRNLARLSAAGLPVVTVTHGSSTAGGAYQTGLSDYIVMVRGRTRAFLAGPPLLKAATGEIATEEELGGAEMHTGVSGLGDYLAEDDRDAIRIARDIVGALDWNDAAAPARDFAGPRYDAEELLGVMPMDHKRPVDMREVIARIVDDSDFLEFSDRYGATTVCGHARIEGHAVGFITNNGPLDVAGANKATHFIQACCQSRTPLIYLNNTTGYMVGRAYEEGRHDQARLENDSGGDERHRAADHALLRRLVRRRQLRHVRTRLPSALLLLLAQRQDGGDGRRAGGRNHGHRHRGGGGAQRSARRSRADQQAESRHRASVRQSDGCVLDQCALARRRRHRSARHARGAGANARHLPRGRGARA
jgi:geranyl-CoA carboxylase beta subunit